MSLLTILLVIIVAGFVLYLVNNMIPMDRKIKKNPQHRGSCNCLAA